MVELKINPAMRSHVGMKLGTKKQESQCQSFGNNSDKCSQPRKRSIGIMVDSAAKLQSKNLDAYRVAIPVAGETNNGKVNNIKGVANRANGNQQEPPLDDKSPMISTRSIHMETTLKSVHPVEEPSNLLDTHEMCNLSAGTKITPRASSAQFSEFENLEFLSNKAEEKEGNYSAVDVAGKFSLTEAHEDMPVKASAVDKSERADTNGTDYLRMQLQKILQKVSSPTKHCSDSEILDDGAKGSRAEKVVIQNHNPKASSDTIENDTQSHDPTVRRPVTRSLNKKRATPKSQLKKSKKKVSPRAQEERFEMLYPGGKKSRRLRGAATGGGSLTTHESLTKRKRSEIEVPEMSNGMDAVKKKEQNTKRNKAPHAERSSDTIQSYEKSKRVFAELRFDTSEKDISESPVVEKEKSKSVFVEPRVDTSEKDAYKSPVVEKAEQLRDINGSKWKENLYRPENLACSSLKENFDPKPDMQHSTFATKTPLERSFIGSLPKSRRVELDGCINTEILFNPKSFQNFKGFQRSSRQKKSNEQDVSSDDAAVLEYPPPLKPKSLFGEEDCVGPFQSPSPHDSNPESSEDRMDIEGSRKLPSLSAEIGTRDEPKFSFKPSKGFFTEKGCRKSPSLSAEIGTTDEQKFALKPVKGFFSEKGCRESPLLSAEIATADEPKFAFKPGKGFFNEKEIEDSDSPLRQSSPSEDDGFDRAVNLFAFTLQRIRSKMKSLADKRSAEILMSAAEGIHNELNNAEIQTQADLRTLISRSKANQKHLDAKFQEQQEQLNGIYEKFKEELNQHLQGCRSTLEHLEEHETELKAAIEKQKVSKRKLLMQLEEEIQSQLVDAHRRITDVHHLARDKMHQLKAVVAECFKLS
ncbi:unnamed protein product [Cuscuta epithymum]|uniref:Meiosis-specific protein ASY3-like coiled-coil domain-containing protein n=1 Tax=Cuscuta epithymum TaxID=186058 RepID=A0AAV0C667_9ASTE|nr:unnamed protein product [Cuscuta epithymum]